MGESRSGEDDWRWGTWAAVLTRTVRPSWQFIESGRVGQWTLRLPEHDELLAASRELQDMISAVAWSSEVARRDAWWLGLRVLLMSGAASAAELTDETFEVAGAAKGWDVFDAALVQAGTLKRGPQHGSTRWRRIPQRTSSELVDIALVPDRFRAVTIGYLDEFRTRVAPVDSSVREKSIALGHWWSFIEAQHPEVGSCADIRPVHARGFLEYAQQRARVKRRRLANDDGSQDRGTAYVWVGAVRLFFADVSTWGIGDGSALFGHAPPHNPFGARDRSLEIGKIKKRRGAAMAATVLEVERELPNVRAFAFGEWDVTAVVHASPTGSAKSPNGRRSGHGRCSSCSSSPVFGLRKP